MRKTLIAAGVVAAFALSHAPPAPAQSGGPGSRLIERILDRRADIAAALALTPAQQQQWNALGRLKLATVIDTRAAVADGVARVEADLALSNPDLRATQAYVDALVDQRLAAHRVVRDAQLDFYDTLNPTQQATVRAELLERLDRLDRLRELLLDFAGLAQ
jgi:Spy/CpxP family protein refolding chaperone